VWLFLPNRKSSGHMAHVQSCWVFLIHAGYQVRNEEGKCAARNKFCRADWVRHGGETAFIFGGKSFRKIFRSDLALVLTEVNKSEAGGGLKQRTIGH